MERLKRFGHDVAGLRCKSWHDFTGPSSPRMDFVITLCDAPQGQQCPDLGETFVTAEWPLPDPADFQGAPAERAALIAELYGMIRRRIEIFTSLPFATLDRMALKARLDEIGDAALHRP
jgi:arsenate reductase